ncbi:hypothetical protein NPX13_g9670 [Xylaria arbuscula]|uniref:Pentacotripeptide-repeat region of PRORP domain-containing protein n=1 Tax=Xylaria arbuscula TaxID=114810 RepID=A0A9W8N5Z3_9PEZI|nr:hypothetical protein NPX13_g9670 [Xylaria arbuscula]
MRSRPSHVSPRLYTSSPPHQPDGSRGQDSATTDDHQIPDGSAANTKPTSAESSGQETLATSDERSHTATIDRLLVTKNLTEVDLLWRHYKSLSERSQRSYAHRVLSLFSQSGRVTDSWKISELFHNLEPSTWDNNVFVAGVAAEINLQNLSEALSIFEKGLRSSTLDNPTLVDALDMLLASALRSPTTGFLENIWQLYPDMAKRWDFDGIAADLNHCASVPGIVEKVLMFPEYIARRLSDPQSSELDREALQVLQRILVRRAVISCNNSQVTPLLLLTKDPLAFEEFLRSAQKTHRRKTSPEVYALYRQMPGSSPSHAVLHAVFQAYTQMTTPYPKMLAGVEMLWNDWIRFHDVPSRRAYQKFLGFYSGRGNKERVYSLWAEYVERFRNDPVINIFDNEQGSDTFAHLLHVHAVNAEPEEAQRIFDDMINKFRIQPSLYDWNILLNAYAKANDYSGAVATFERLCQAGKPDKFSYGTLMQMAGSRGDLAFTVDLYRRARSSRVPVNDAMLSSLIDAYCQNDLFKEAEDVCIRATNKELVTTLMWNKLLHYNALSRDLSSINRILGIMADKNIPYNEFTYQQLLLGLALCRQSLHALNLLTVALKEHVFEVTATHFQIVMSALLRTGEPALVRRLCLLMNEHKVPITEGVMFRLSQSLGQWENLPPNQRRKRSKTQWYGDALRIFFRIYGHGSDSQIKNQDPARTKPVRWRELLRSGREVHQFGTMMYIFAQLNDNLQVNELLELYRYVFQGPNNEGILPLSLLNAVMLSSLHDQRHDRVKSTWRFIFDVARTEARPADFKEGVPHVSKISPRYRYALSTCLRVMQEVLFRENNHTGLQELVKEVRDAGFEIDSKNWNYHVQILVQMKQYKAAFAVCEKLLMPNWTGWHTVRAKEAMRSALPLDTRRKGMSSRYLRPTATTLYRLAQAYLELDRMGPWSSDAFDTLREIESDSIQVIRAIKSMIRVYSNLEYEIFEAVDSIDTVPDESELESDATNPEGDLLTQDKQQSVNQSA